MIAVMLFVFNSITAQTVYEESATAGKENAVDFIVNTSDGNVEIDIPEHLKELLMIDSEANRKPTQPTLHQGLNKLNGYRIQVFGDGRNHSTLEARAKARGGAIAARFPKYRGQVYTFSNAPNWYTRIGNFRSQHDANNALAELKRAFPAFASEMRVVKSQIIIIK